MGSFGLPTLPVSMHALRAVSALTPSRVVIPRPPAAEAGGPRPRPRAATGSGSCRRILHCSVVGTCLSTGDLRQLFAKLNDPDARTASDHALHGRRCGPPGRRRPPAAAEQAARQAARDRDQALRQGADGGARCGRCGRRRRSAAISPAPIGRCWSTPPPTGPRWCRRCSGEVHMLSHLVGMSNRADIARLRHLEQELARRDEKLARQEERLQQIGAEREALARRVVELEQAARRQAQAPAPTVPAEDESVRRRPGRRAGAVPPLPGRGGRLAQREEREEGGASPTARPDGRNRRRRRAAAALQDEIAALEVALDEAGGGARRGRPGRRRISQGRTLLYVGGRPKQVERLRALSRAARRRAAEPRRRRRGQPDAAAGPGQPGRYRLFPVDCVSHHAAGQGEAPVPRRPKALRAAAHRQPGQLRRRGRDDGRARPRRSRTLPAPLRHRRGQPGGSSRRRRLPSRRPAFGRGCRRRGLARRRRRRAPAPSPRAAAGDARSTDGIRVLCGTGEQMTKQIGNAAPVRTAAKPVEIAALDGPGRGLQGMKAGWSRPGVRALRGFFRRLFRLVLSGFSCIQSMTALPMLSVRRPQQLRASRRLQQYNGKKADGSVHANPSPQRGNVEDGLVQIQVRRAWISTSPCSSGRISDLLSPASPEGAGRCRGC